MEIHVEALDKVRKKIEVVLPEEKITEIRDEIYDDLRKKAKIKGFRPGKVPRGVLTTYYKDFIAEELKKKMVETTMGEALHEAQVEPVVEPLVDFIEEDGRTGYTLECEVLPEIEQLPEYKGVEVEVEPIAVTDEEVQQRLEGMRDMHSKMENREVDATAETGNIVIIKYEGFRDGQPLKNVKSEAYPIELGSANIMPDLENALLGMKAGEEKEVTVHFPDDYPDKEIASRDILFKVLVKEIKQKIRPEASDDFAKELEFESLDAMMEQLRQQMEKEKEAGRKQYVAQKVMEQLTGALDIPVPGRVRENRVESMLEDARSRLNIDRFPEEERVKIEANFKKDFETKAEERIKGEILLARIAKEEGITSNDGDVEERMKRMAEEAKRPYEDVRNFYEQYNLTGSLKESIVQEKALNLLLDNAIIREKA